MPGKLENHHWEVLLKMIEAERCTPFLGAGASYPRTPLGGEVAREWAQEAGYPLDDCQDLGRVAQFLAVKTGDPMYPRVKFVERLNLRNAPPPTADEPLHQLAGLPFPLYITTNYDDLMLRALRDINKNPRLDICRWHDMQALQDVEHVLGSNVAFEPSDQEPVVYYLHGYHRVLESMVLTEDDYLTFMVNVSRDQQRDRLPHRIHRAFAGSLLFVGYSLRDWNFRMLFHWVAMSSAPGLSSVSISVQLPEADAAKANWLDEYFRDKHIRVYWGTAEEFAAELKERWEARGNGS